MHAHSSDVEGIDVSALPLLDGIEVQDFDNLDPENAILVSTLESRDRASAASRARKRYNTNLHVSSVSFNYRVLSRDSSDETGNHQYMD